VADGDAAGGRRREIDVIDTHGAGRDHPQLGTGVDQPGIDAIAEQAQQALRRAGAAAERLRRRRARPGPDLRLGSLAQAFQGATREASSHEDAGPGLHPVTF
jgi:hypothetical protein